MRTYAASLTALLIGSLGPTLAPAAPTVLRCILTREVANPVEGAHISFRLVRYVRVDPDANSYQEADESGRFWPDQCTGVGQRCRFSPKTITVSESRVHDKASTTVDRYSLRYNRESDNDVVQALTYGACAEISAMDLPGARRF